MTNSAPSPRTLGCTRKSEHTHHRDYYVDVVLEEESIGSNCSETFVELHQSPAARSEFEENWGEVPELDYFYDFAVQISGLEIQYWNDQARQERNDQIEKKNERLRALGPAHPDYFNPAIKAAFAWLDRKVGVPEGTNIQIVIARAVREAEAAGDPAGLPNEVQL